MTIIYILFVCYVPVLTSIVPAMYGDVNYLWIIFFLLVYIFFIRPALFLDIDLANKWIYILLTFYFTVIASVSWTDHFSYDLFIIQRLFARAFVPFAIAVIALGLFNLKKNVHLCIKHICIVAFILSIISVYQMFTSGFSVDEEFRSTASFQNPNTLAIFLVLVIPGIIYATEKRVVNRIFGIITLVSLILGILATVSRKGITSMVFCFLLYFILRKQIKMLLLLICAFSVIGSILFSSDTFIRERFMQEKIETNIESRSRSIRIGMEMFRDHYFIGLGYNGFSQNLPKYVSGARKYSAHDIYITMLTNYGLIGFIPFMGIFLYPLFVSVRVLWGHGALVNQYHKDMALICVCSIVPFMVSLYFSGGSYGDYYGISILYTQVSFILAQVRSLKKVGIQNGQEAYMKTYKHHGGN